MWYDSLRVTSDASQEANEVPKIVVNGYSFAERCQRLGKAIEWVKREMSKMRAHDELLTRELEEMEHLTMELLPELTPDRNRSRTLPSSTRTSAATIGIENRSPDRDEMSPEHSPKMKRTKSESKRRQIPAYVSQSSLNLYESEKKSDNKDIFLKSSVSLLQLNSSDLGDRRVSADSGLPSDDTEPDGLGVSLDLSFSTDVFAALANIHGISVSNSKSTTV